jgi:2-polyprenyl-6-methoxyphenol hydroxylase-like FAD-dependent oxidoreductase
MVLKKKTLIIGGGISGMSLAIQLRKSGHPVDLIEIDPAWRIDGAGITISGPTLRAFKEIGVIDQIMEQGWCADGFSLGLASGQIIDQIPTPRVAGPDIPGGGAIMRPVLAAILSKATRASSANVKLGVSFTSLEQEGDKVRVAFTDGTSDSYDVVVGADGVMSKTRAIILPDAPAPEFTGQGSWRAVIPRAPHIEHATFFLGKTTKAGVNPVSKDEMYLGVTQSLDEDKFFPPDTWPAMLADLLAEFSGTVGQIRDELNPQSRIVYRPLHKLLVAPPWHKGNIGLLGDAVHATTPHLASGAGIGVEDAIVLAEELGRHATGEQAFAAFTARRFERCRLVVQASAQLGEFERAGTPEAKEAHAQLMRSTMRALAMPI